MMHCSSTEWIQQYTDSFFHPDKLQQSVDSFMEGYDKRKEEVRILHPHPHPTITSLLDSWLQLRFCLCHRKRSGRRRRLSSSRRTRRAGWRSQEEARAPRLAPTVRQPIRGRYRRRWGRRRGRSSWTSTPGSTETHRKNVSCHWKFAFNMEPQSLNTSSEWGSRNSSVVPEFLFMTAIFFPFSLPDIAELRKKFEEDKQRIALLRAQRKFRPYWVSEFFFFAHVTVLF